MCLPAIESQPDFRTVDENLRHCFEALAGGRLSAQVCAAAGVRAISLGVGFQLFNAAFLDSPVEDEHDLQTRIQWAGEQLGSGRLKWSFWMCESWLTPAVRRRAERVLHRGGLSLVSEMPGMVIDGLNGPDRPLPVIEIRRVADEGDRAAFCDIGSACFNVPISLFGEVFDSDMAARPQFAAYIGYAEGRPVATAAAVVTGDVVGIYNVATMPGLRRRGYAEAVMRFAIQQTGCRRSVLQSSIQGLRMYERMGYKAICKFRVFTS